MTNTITRKDIRLVMKYYKDSLVCNCPNTIIAEHSGFCQKCRKAWLGTSEREFLEKYMEVNKKCQKSIYNIS